MSLTRRVLIVDDNSDFKEEQISAFDRIFSKIKKDSEENNKQLIDDCSIEYDWADNIDEGIKMLKSEEYIYDVILIDYDFTTDEKARKGVDLVIDIRKYINKRCKIIFYTMRGLSDFDTSEFISLINNDVYRFVLKSGETFDLKYNKVGNKADQVIVEAIIDAINDYDPICQTLEKFFIDYQNKIKEITVDGEEYSPNEIIKSIRMDGEIGNEFINNTLKISVLNSLKFLR